VTFPRPWQIGVICCVFLALLSLEGCNSVSPEVEAQEPNTAKTEEPEPAPREDPVTAPNPSLNQLRGQVLPVTAETMLGGQTIGLEVAQTPQQQAIGLMYRETLPDDRGMLFPFVPPRPASFWMKNVLISLDMVFVYDGEIIAIARNVPPCETDPCPTYGPGLQLVDAVIELRGGRADELGLQVGDRVDIQPREDPAEPAE
jgi:hypothetical protein